MQEGEYFREQAWHNGLCRPLGHSLYSYGRYDLYPSEGKSWGLCDMSELQVKCIDESLISERRLKGKFR